MRNKFGDAGKKVVVEDFLEGIELSVFVLTDGNSYVVLFFYSSTCDHCHEQMPLLMNLYREMRPRGVEVIGIALDDNVEDFDRTIREKGLLFPCYTELVARGSWL